LRARRTNRCSAPKISVVSASTAEAPMAASISEHTPSAGFAVMPENESEPPQFSPSTMREAGTSTRSSAAPCSIIRVISARAAATAPRVPPLDCSVMPTSRLLRGALGPR
jgi:hypothetical protein